MLLPVPIVSRGEARSLVELFECSPDRAEVDRAEVGQEDPTDGPQHVAVREAERHVEQLEDRLGVRLIQRTSRQFVVRFGCRAPWAWPSSRSSISSPTSCPTTPRST